MLGKDRVVKPGQSSQARTGQSAKIQPRSEGPSGFLVSENLSMETQTLLSRDLSLQVLLYLLLGRTINLLPIELLHHLFLIAKNLIVSGDRHILNFRSFENVGRGLGTGLA